MNGALLLLLASKVAERHRIPKAAAQHPKGVIVPGDSFMTKKLEDPDYVPYCMMHSTCGRVRRTEYGFQCPTCLNQMNYDLTHYNGNTNVKYAASENPSAAGENT